MTDKLLKAAPDLFGVTGLCMLGGGVWVGYGLSPALIITGSLMLAVGIFAAAKGGR